MSRSTCLDADELIALHRGDVPEDLLAPMAAHLEACPRCEAAARALDEVSDPTVAAYRRCATVGPTAGRPAEVGSYEILGEIGHGGMGVVYKARHRQLQRVVALKTLLAGSLADPECRRRFRAEAEAVARLQHPSIVQIYEVGDYAPAPGEARPYFTLEFVDGGSLADRLRDGPQSPQRAAAWLEALARAVHYAHQQGIVHRDLKPSNILLARAADESGGAVIVPKICDFGVAKLLAGSEAQTLSGMLVGTAEYMAPEQAEGRANVGPAADIYALGAVLYALLTGRPPFQGTNVLATLGQVRDQEPVPPRRLQPLVPTDLNTVCLKCLHKEPGKRYASALALADDLQRFRAGQPIQARPTGAAERALKWARRRPLDALLTAAVVLVTVVGFALVMWQWRRAEAEAATELLARREADRRLAGALLDQGTGLCEKGDVDRGLIVFARALGLAVRTGDADLERVARVNLSAWQHRLIRQKALLPHYDSWVWAVALSPDGKLAASGGDSGLVQRWDVATGQPVGEPLRHAQPVWAIAFSPDGARLITGSGGRPVTGGAFDDTGGEARVWDARTGRPLTAPLTLDKSVAEVAVSRDGAAFLTITAAGARLWQTADGQPLGPPLATSPELLAAALGPDGTTVLTGSADGTARLWNGRTGAPVGGPMRHEDAVQVVAFRPDGQQLLTGTRGGVAKLWLAAGAGPVAVLPHRGPLKAAAFSADGRLLATGSDIEEGRPGEADRRIVAGEARVWEAATGRPLLAPLRHPPSVRVVAFSPDGRVLATGCRDGCARFFGVASGDLIGKPLQHEGLVRALVFSRDGRLALTGSAGGDHYAAARLWEMPPPAPQVRALPSARATSWSVFSPTGDLLVTGIDSQPGARRWDVASGRPIGEPLGAVPVAALALSPDGRTLAIGTGTQPVGLWDCRAGRHLRDCPGSVAVTTAAFSPDGKLLLTGDRARRVRLIDVAGGETIDAPWACAAKVIAVAFRPDGAALWLEGDDRGQRLWAGQPHGPAQLLWEQPEGIHSAVFRGDGAMLLTSDGPHAQLRDARTGRPHGPAFDHGTDLINALAFSPDGRTVVTGGNDKAARLWDVATGKRLGPPLPHREPVAATLFHPDGRSLFTANDDADARWWQRPGAPAGEAGAAPTLHLWQMPTPLAGDAAEIMRWAEALTGLEVDGQGAIRTASLQ